MSFELCPLQGVRYTHVFVVISITKEINYKWFCKEQCIITSNKVDKSYNLNEVMTERRKCCTQADEDLPQRGLVYTKVEVKMKLKTGVGLPLIN